MGRAKTPVQFNKALAARLRAARIAAGYDTQAPFAKELGIELERYKKWESGRTPIQHEFLPRVCELTGKDANFFYAIQPVEQTHVIRRTGTQ
jgi:transcriptional regulator with XRE-family HTH domain